MNAQDYIDEAQDSLERKDKAANIKNAKSFKFGQHVDNTAASNCNPIKYGLFVRIITRKGFINPGTYVQMTDGKGSFWEIDAAYVVDG